MSKYVFFKETKEPYTKTRKRWNVDNSKEVIGIIAWYSNWRQYCFFTYPDIVLSVDCLDKITDFIKEHKNDRREVSKE